MVKAKRRGRPGERRRWPRGRRQQRARRCKRRRRVHARKLRSHLAVHGRPGRVVLRHGAAQVAGGHPRVRGEGLGVERREKVDDRAALLLGLGRQLPVAGLNAVLFHCHGAGYLNGNSD